MAVSPGGDQPHKGAGFEEGEAGDEAVGPGAERVREVGERGLEIGWLHEPSRDHGEHDRGEQPAAKQDPARQPGGRFRRGRVGQVHAGT
jgi:hypothetical protein